MDFNYKVRCFMFVYMFEIEKLLNSKSKELLKISYQMDEANTDRPLKEYIKSEIVKYIHDLKKTENNYLNIYKEDGKIDRISIKEISDIYIKNVYLPNEINNEIKSQIYLEKSGVYTEPDLCIELTDGKNIGYETIELKTTKNDAIPGSSVQQITTSEWTIFVKHNDDAEVSTGQYLFALNSKVQFPDRSPRPQVSYSEIKNWNNHFRKNSGNEISYLYDSEASLKMKWIKDWKKALVQSWLDMLFGKVKENGSWFNDCLKIFARELLEKYGNCSKEEREAFTEKIKKVD